MAVKKWSDIRAQKFSPAELGQLDQEIENELLEMDLRALQEASTASGSTSRKDK